MSLIREAVLRASTCQPSLVSSARVSHQALRVRQVNRPRHTGYICRSCRSFSSQGWKGQQAAARAPEPEQNRPASLNPKDEKQLNEALDQTHPFGIAAKHTHHFKSPQAQGEQRAQTAPPPSHLQDPSPTLTTRAPRTPTMFASPRKSLAYVSSQASQSQRDHLKGMMFPTIGAGDRRSFIDMNEKPPQPDQSVYEAMHLTSRTGKTLAVDSKSSTDLAVKLGKLEMLVARNKIRADLFRQRFHERGGLKRKRLKSERWRRRFKKTFVKTVARVQELRRKGW
jgi:small subunit ribosomal protein MRP21